MVRDFKPVNDRTINDVNQANRAAWDSGEFRHTAADESDAQPEGSTVIPKKAVHLPRRAGRQWRKGEWS